MLLNFDTWIEVKDGDREAFELMRRHYSFYNYADKRRDDPHYRNRRLFVGPGRKLVLLTPCCRALFAWRKFIDDSGQIGVNCCVFRNEGAGRSSDLILAAEQIAIEKFGKERFYTYVNPGKTARRRSKKHRPGHCFIMAGWTECGVTKSGKIILEKFKGGP